MPRGGVKEEGAQIAYNNIVEYVTNRDSIVIYKGNIKDIGSEGLTLGSDVFEPFILAGNSNTDVALMVVPYLDPALAKETQK